jgi:3'-phosphoadenosine 5'-phosphosulfate sulfotransferase (PAPS reductase)/FAD synthetase
MSNPYEILEPTCISFSGGRTSAYMLYKVLETGGGQLPSDAVVCFANTGKEDEATLKFVHDCSTNWNVPIVWLEYRNAEDTKDRWTQVTYETASRNGEPFEAVIRKKNYLPNPVTRFCTIEMKIRTIANYLFSKGMC